MTSSEVDLIFVTRLAGLKQRLLELYGPKEVAEWFESPHELLQWRRPIDLILDNTGYLEISRMLDAILDGAFI